MKYQFSNSEKEKICELFENGVILKEIGKIFRYSKTSIRKILIKKLGLEKYKEIAKKHLKETRSKNLKKWMKENPEEHKKICQKGGQKGGLISGPKNITKAQKLPRTENQCESSRKNGQITGPENIKKYLQTCQRNNASIYEKQFKNALEDENILFEWQVIIDFPEENFLKFAVADFLVDSNIIIEIDGGTHQIDPSYDIRRDEICMNLGYTIFRFSHEDIKNHLDFCITKIKEEITHEKNKI